MASKSYSCPACPTESICNRTELSKHYSVFHKGRQIPCPLCKVEISRIEELRKHLKIHEPNRNRGYKCRVKECDKSFYTTADAKQHFARLHSSKRPFPCPFQCGKYFKTKAEVKIHILSHTQKRHYKCDQCNGSFKHKSHLQSQVKNQHVFKDEESQKCSQCEVKFKAISNLKYHIQNIHALKRTKDFLCALCPSKFFTKQRLIQHSVTHDSQRKLEECYFCFKQLTRGSMIAHLRIHTSEKPYYCAEKNCNYSTTSRGVLHQHGRTHHHQSLRHKKHTCYFCMAAFIHPNGMVRHMRTHTREEPFSCKLCKKHFNLLSNLNQHVRYIHTKEKPYKCNQCDKFFSCGRHLKIHTATHTGEKRFFCELCNYSSYHSGHLKRHHKSRH